MLSVLSPKAEPFEPSYWTIYNDGVPSVTIPRGSETEILHGIPDEALDDAFPPTAEEAAEMEAVEVFVELLANLAILEEKEEATRIAHTGMGKRWEARRELHGKPRPASHRVEPELHGGHHAATSALVPRRADKKIQAREAAAMIKAVRAPKQSPSAAPRRSKNIQQPRKQS